MISILPIESSWVEAEIQIDPLVASPLRFRFPLGI